MFTSYQHYIEAGLDNYIINNLNPYTNGHPSDDPQFDLFDLIPYLNQQHAQQLGVTDFDDLIETRNQPGFDWCYDGWASHRNAHMYTVIFTNPNTNRTHDLTVLVP